MDPLAGDRFGHASFLMLLAMALAVLASSGRAAAGEDVERASGRLNQALHKVDRSLNRLPVNLQDPVGSGIKVTLSPLRRSARELGGGLGSGLHEGVATEVNHAADVLNALSAELDQIAEQRIDQLNEDTLERLRQLQSIASESTAQIQSSLDEAIDRARNSVLEIENQAGVTVRRVIDRSLLAAIRLAGSILFLVGLLTLGLRLHAVVESGTPWAELTRRNVLLAWLAPVIILVALGASLLLALRPETLAARYAFTEPVRESDPCIAYEKQKTWAARAHKVGNAELVQSTRKRLESARHACFPAPGSEAK